MKHLLILAFVALFTCKALAQQTHPPLDHKTLNPEEHHLPTAEVTKHIGKDVYIYDVVWGHKAVNDTLTVLYVGGVYPHHQVTVLLKGKQVLKEFNLVREGMPMHFGGIVTTYEGKPAITIINSVHLGTRIQL